jgi:hypothetical protein
MSDPGRAFKRALYSLAAVCERWRPARSEWCAVNQVVINGEDDGMGIVGRGWRSRALAAAVVLALGADAFGEGPDATEPADGDTLIGQYRHSTVFAGGKTKRSVATIAARGAGFSIAWEEDDGNLFGGIAIRLDGILGAAYTEALNGSYRGQGVLAYRISGGTLDGVRLPADAADGALVRETLEGSPTLEGRYAIARSLDAGGRTYHSGYVDIARDGDTYQMTWYTPARSYEGVGLRVGDVLVASYGNGFARSAPTA